jgi:hypothetical protein
MGKATKRKTRTTTVNLGNGGSEITEKGLTLNRWEAGTTHRVQIEFGCIQNAAWLAGQALEWIQMRREEIDCALKNVELDLKNARGGGA